MDSPPSLLDHSSFVTYPYSECLTLFREVSHYTNSHSQHSHMHSTTHSSTSPPHKSGSSTIRQAESNSTSQGPKQIQKIHLEPKDEERIGEIIDQKIKNYAKTGERIGAVAGGIVGCLGGPRGAAVGAGVGAGIGAAIGGTVGWVKSIFSRKKK